MIYSNIHSERVKTGTLNILGDLQCPIPNVNEEDINCWMPTNAQEIDKNSSLFEDLISDTSNQL